jgi:tetratricopeptide (TPR) repeat protein
MKNSLFSPRRPGLRAWLIAVVWAWLIAAGPAARAAERAPQATVIAVSGRVEFLSAGSSTWYVAATNLVLYSGDQLRTGERSRAFLRLRDQSVLPVKDHSTLRLADRPESVLIQLLRGAISFFHRDEPGSLEVEGGGINAAVRGTEAAFAVLDDGTTTVTVFDGEVAVTDDAQRSLVLPGGAVAVRRPGEAPRRTGSIVLGDWTPVQWALRYPAILDPTDLGWTSLPDPSLKQAWDAYHRGHLPRALAAYPAGRTPTSPEEHAFLAALLLGAGSVDEAERLLAAVPDSSAARPLADAQARLIEVIRRGPGSDPAARLRTGGEAATRDGSATASGPPGRTATELLGRSYAAQAAGRLADARDLAAAAARQSPGFGFASVREAELEFSLGRRRAAEDALLRSEQTSPDNAAARALRGFVEAAANDLRPALAAFEAALALDPSYAPAWLGRGLARIRRGDLAAGREDLLTAAALEPQSSLLRSSLAKAFSDSAPFRTVARPDRARAELDLARRLDPGDPTPWLYAALLDEQENRVNDAIGDLERSKALNDNRLLYRSGGDVGGSSGREGGMRGANSLGLDQDLAVRGANLARVFADAGFQDLAVREASRAVNLDYANAASHLFLANSYDSLRDPRQINLRYETPWLGEYLLANLLAPVGAGSLSQTVAQNEYSKLFERDRLGLANTTLWTSNGDWLQRAAQFGQTGDLAYSLDAYYRSEVGQRLNNDLEHLALTATVHLQASPDDTLLVQAGWYDAESGDVLQRHDPSAAIPGLRIHERQEPLAFVGWNHTWQPGSHTLFLVSPWNTGQHYVNPAHQAPYSLRDANGDLYSGFATVPLDAYDSRFAGVSLELQQIWTVSAHSVVAGARYQYGALDTTARLDTADFDPAVPADSAVDPSLDRFGLYAYDRWQLLDRLLFTAGVSWDRLTQPLNFRAAPLTAGTDTLDQVAPKLGIEFEPWRGGLLRGAWTRSLGGVSLDQSFRLEPVQVAGFNQAYRSLIPESLAGSVAGQAMETLGIGFDQTFATRTWATLAAERMTSDASRDVGGFEYSMAGFESVGAFREDLDFTEHALGLTVGQLVGRDLALTVRYRIAEAELADRFPGLANPGAGAGGGTLDSDQRSVLQQLALGARYQHPRGLFASWESVWNRQTNHDDIASLAGDDFWQHNVRAGWRFWQRRAEVAVGLLNLTDEDYRLHPLNYYAETYRERTLTVSGRFAF